MGRTERKVRQLLFDASLAELMSDEFKQRLVESMSESDKAKLRELLATRPHLNVLREEERMGLLGLYLIFLKLNPAFAEKYIRFLDNMFQLPDLNASLNQALDARMLAAARSKMNGSVQKKGRQAEMDQTVLQYIERYNEARGRVGGRYDYYKMLGVDEVVGPRGERVWRYKGIPGNPNLRLLVVAEKGTGRGVVVHYELRDTMYRQHNFQDIVTAQMAQHYEDR